MSSEPGNSDAQPQPFKARDAVFATSHVAFDGARAARVVGALIAACIVLLATHAGEFWPFSVYPMFSGAGRPWQRALVRGMPEDAASGALLPEYALDMVPGRPLPLRQLAPQDDLSTLVQRAEGWSDDETNVVAHMFGSLPCSAPLLVLRVRGSLAEGRVRELAVPVAWLSCDRGEVRLQPLLGHQSLPSAHAPAARSPRG
jgi:hypothetical protein